MALPTDFTQNLAQFVRTHEKALANALQLRRQPLKKGRSAGYTGDEALRTSGHQNAAAGSSSSNALAAAFSLGSLHFLSHNIKPAKLALTPHHLYYLLHQFEELGIPIGPMKVRLENIHTDASPANYVSFLSEAQRSRGRSDRDSIHSVSSVRSVMSGMSSLWSNFGLSASTSAAKTERAEAQQLTDLKYLYSAFTKIPCLRLSPDRKARLIKGYEEFPFDTAVPLIAFKNLSALEICDVDFRQFYGWDILADQLRSLIVKRSKVDDLTDILINIVLDDMDKRRRRSSKTQGSPTAHWPSSPPLRYHDVAPKNSATSSPMNDDQLSQSTSPKHKTPFHVEHEASVATQRPRTKSLSPSRPSSARQDGSYRHVRASPIKVKRSASGSSNSSTNSIGPLRSGSSSNLISMGFLPASKWRFLRHLSLADNSLTCIAASGLGPLSDTLHSLDLSSNLFAEVPDCLAILTALRALNLSNCMVESLHSLARNPLPAVTAFNLRANRLVSIAGIERLMSLERLDLRDNEIQDPMELARLTGIPGIHEIWVLHNPFVRTHTNYRVTIFNLFRGTPGYSDDVIIDTSAPGYSERKQLRERAVEPEGIPTINPLCPEQISSISPMETPSPDISNDREAQALRRPLPPQTTQSEIIVGSGRRRKGQRRRIVDLAQDQNSSVIDEYQIPKDAQQLVPQLDFKRTITDHPSSSTRMTSHEPPHLQPTWTASESSKFNRSEASSTKISEKGRSLATELKNLDFNGDAYRHKIEALKGEVGSNWLSVLTEESWRSHQQIPSLSPQLNSFGMMRTEPKAFRASSQVVNGPRTTG